MFSLGVSMECGMKHRVFAFLKRAGGFLLHVLFMFTLISLSLPFVFGMLFGRMRSRAGRACMAVIYGVTTLAYGVMVTDAMAAFEGTSFLAKAPSDQDALFVFAFELSTFAVGMVVASILRRMGDARLPRLAWLPVTQKQVLQLMVCIVIASIAAFCDVADRDPQVAMFSIGQQLNEASPDQVEEFNEAVRDFLSGMDERARR